jgi:type I restriction enzyme, R subunit
LATEAEALLIRFPNARVNIDEHRRLRAALYRPLLGLEKEERGRVVEAILAILLDGGSDANS